MVDKNERDSRKGLIGWIVVGLLIVAIVVLTFMFRKNAFIDSAKKYLEENSITVKDSLMIEALDIEDDGFSTGLKETCIEESYVLAKKNKDGELEYTEFVICDDEEPTIKLKGSSKITININEEYEELGATAKIGDKDISDRIVIDTSKLDTAKVGSYKITYTITDRYGNSDSVTRTVEIIDNVAPVISLYGGSTVTVYVGSKFTEPGYYATDNVDGTISNLVKVSGSVNTSVIGTYKLTYEIEDKAKNKASTTRTVNVVDVPAPVITLNGGNVVYHTANTPFVDPGFGATDAGTGIITDKVTVSGSVDVSKLGSYTLYYSVTGSRGKTTTVTRTVIVVDNIAPVITLKGEDTVTVYIGQGVYAEAGYTVTDNFDKQPTVSIDNPVLNDVAGTYIITYTAIDASGNKSSVKRTVIVKDVPDAIITVDSELEIDVEFGSIFTVPSATANDVILGDGLTVTIDEAVDTSVIGDYEVVYKFTGTSGNEVTVTLIVHVVDKEDTSITTTIPRKIIVEIPEEVIITAMENATIEGQDVFFAIKFVDKVTADLFNIKYFNSNTSQYDILQFDANGQALYGPPGTGFPYTTGMTLELEITPDVSLADTTHIYQIMIYAASDLITPIWERSYSIKVE